VDNKSFVVDDVFAEKTAEKGKAGNKEVAEKGKIGSKEGAEKGKTGSKEVDETPSCSVAVSFAKLYTGV